MLTCREQLHTANDPTLVRQKQYCFVLIDPTDVDVKNVKEFDPEYTKSNITFIFSGGIATIKYMIYYFTVGPGGSPLVS